MAAHVEQGENDVTNGCDGTDPKAFSCVHRVAEMDYTDVLGLIRSAGRPLTLTLARTWLSG